MHFEGNHGSGKLTSANLSAIIGPCLAPTEDMNESKNNPRIPQILLC